MTVPDVSDTGPAWRRALEPLPDSHWEGIEPTVLDIPGIGNVWVPVADDESQTTTAETAPYDACFQGF